MLEHIEDSDVTIVTYHPYRDYDLGSSGGALKFTFRPNAYIKTTNAAILEVLTLQDGCSIMPICTDDLPRLRHFLVLAVLQLDKLIEKRA